MSIHITPHPLARHLVTELRDVTTEPSQFRSLTNRLTIILALEATRDLKVREESVTTPLETTAGARLRGALVVVPILRAGLGMLPSLVVRRPLHGGGLLLRVLGFH